MKKLSIKDLIEFRNKSDRAKKNFAASLKFEKEKVEKSEGGNYWITSLSAISNSYRYNVLQHIKDKIDDLEEKVEETENERTKIMHQRNIDILYNFEDFDFKAWRPSKNLKVIKKNKADSILKLNGIQIQATPHHIFTFGKDEVKEIGGIWFIAKLSGYRKDELGMFVDIMHRYLNSNFSDEYTVNPKYCIAVDVVENFAVNYAQLQSGEIPEVLNVTINELKKLM